MFQGVMLVQIKVKEDLFWAFSLQNEILKYLLRDSFVFNHQIQSG